MINVNPPPAEVQQPTASIPKGILAVIISLIALPIIGIIGFFATVGISALLPAELLIPTLAVAVGAGGYGIYELACYISHFFQPVPPTENNI